MASVDAVFVYHIREKESEKIQLSWNTSNTQIPLVCYTNVSYTWCWTTHPANNNFGFALKKAQIYILILTVSKMIYSLYKYFDSPSQSMIFFCNQIAFNILSTFYQKTSSVFSLEILLLFFCFSSHVKLSQIFLCRYHPQKCHSSSSTKEVYL